MAKTKGYALMGFRFKKKKKSQGKGIGKCPQTGKSQYVSTQAGAAGMNFLFRMDPALKPGDLHVYLCPHCGFYHVGHHTKKRAEIDP